MDERVAYVLVGGHELFCGTEENAWWTAWKWCSLEPSWMITLVLGEPRRPGPSDFVGRA